MITEKTERFGTFSSSQIWRLMESDKNGGFKQAAMTYVKKVGFEIKLGRAINKEVTAKSCSWGNLCELFVHELLPLEYALVSKERLFHPDISFYSGAPDLVKEYTVADVKCPFSLEVFCEKVEALKNIETYKKEFPEDYWQHISNAILLEANGIKSDFFEAIIYCPYKSELPAIKEFAANYDGENASQFSWIKWANDNELPYLIDGGYYKNLNIIRFEVLEEHKQLLTERVKKATKLLFI